MLSAQVRPAFLHAPIHALVLALALGFASPAWGLELTGSQLFPRPAELERDVQFWLRIYSEVGTDGGLIHDSRNLGVVYEVVHFPPGTSSRGRDRITENAKDRYRDNLRRLAKGSRNRSQLGSTQARILSLWGENVSSATLRDAAKHVRFQLGQKNKFRAGLIRSGAWRAHIRKTFTDMGLPIELAALPHVESSFNPKAYSRVGAAGLWQFMRSTGRRYMRVDHVVDERMEPISATVAAARLLEHNHRATGTWPLALTAYNHGAAGMRRASRKMGTKDIAVIARKYKSRTFGFASRNFYVEFLAALQIDQDPEKYFGPLPFEAPVDMAETELPFYTTPSALAAALGIDPATLKSTNPSLRSAVWDGAKRIPKGFTLRLPKTLLAQPLPTLVAAVPDNARYAKQTRDSIHKVRRGETLSVIAKRYGVSIRELASINGLRSRNRIRIGQKLRLPDSAASRRASRRVANVTPQAPPKNGMYTVRRGDNLAKIAARFDTTESDLLSWNRIRNRNRISVGQRLRVAAAPKPTVAPEPVATQPTVVAQVPVAPTKPVEQAEPTPEPEPVVEKPIVIASAPAVAPDPKPAEPEPVAPSEVLADTAPAANIPEHPDSLTEFTAAVQEEPEFEIAKASIATGGSVADAAAAERVAAGEPLDALLADPGDYSVASDGTIEVQAAETLGHYAEWLNVRASRLRSMNGMRYGKPIALGKRVRLDLSRVTRRSFEQARADHHLALQGEFFERYELDGTKTHKVRHGDSVWVLAEKKYNVPLWLLRQHNPDVDFASLQAGSRLTIPKLRPR